MGDSYPSREEYKKKMLEGHQEKRIVGKLAIRTMMAFFICGILLIGVFGYTAMAYVKEAPKLNPELLNSPQSSTLYDMNNKKITDVAGAEYRKTISLDQVPKEVQNAFLAVEDARFWKHRGIDVKRVAGAVVANVKEGFGVEGASTITQQLVKMSFLSTEKTIERKVQEAYLALKLEKQYTKEEILEMYLNKVYFGEGAYGIATAAEVYFGKSVKDLNISEAALLAGLLQRPSGYNPYNNPELAETRRNTVLSLMEQHEYISAKERQEAQSIPVKEMLHKQKKKTAYNSFTDQVVRELNEKGISEEDLYTQGLKIYTTYDPEAQKITEKVLTTDEYIAYPEDDFKAGVVLLETKTGEVRAIGGSRDSNAEVQRGFNYGTQMKRQPGSTAKPIMAYGPAIENLKWSTAEQIKDEQIELNGKVFKNWNNRFHGNVSMRTALQWSYNIPAIKAMMEAGPEEARQFAARLGIELEEIFPAYAIGGFKTGVSPLELAGAYAAFGNDGVFNEPHTVRKIVYPDGKEKNLKPEPVQAMSDSTAYMITDMLKTAVVEGTGQMANIPGLPIAGKTGTNELPDHIYGSGVTDAWFAGYTTRYSAAVWTGYDTISQESFVRMEDSHNAKLIFKHIMSQVSEDIETPDFTMPSSVEKMVIGSRAELFINGTAPKRNPVIINKPQKRNEEESEPEITEEEEKDDDANEEVEEEEKTEDKEKQKEEKKAPKPEKEPQKPPVGKKPPAPVKEKPKDNSPKPTEGNKGDGGQGDKGNKGGDGKDNGNNDKGKGNPDDKESGNKDSPPEGGGGSGGSDDKKGEPAGQSSSPPQKSESRD
ncbi:PBP1A family penicillin-binding protein [Siminovitchia acidinfaciens]|uniref:PBP1A family penicillin-binding protein n=1 Tax=Siminovitchia acidinfaciens TaxID=2321395 RepID=A0A429XVY0_9BACI|nr:PBP1A family penicillin-binding protein [Siminovitchia acidinfaciens]RST72509.1 PBP1A family penicillin-binding protein [Siminovitchia acidinfaciens]